MSQPEPSFLPELEAVIRRRLESGVDESYTARLAKAGVKRIAQKVGEEAVELALAAVAGEREETVSEAADLVYHLIVLLNEQGIRLADIEAELQARHRARD